MTAELARLDDYRALARYDQDEAASAIQHILATGDLAQLRPGQRVAHYLALCQSLGLNSLSRPFDWLVLDNRLVLYPNASCAAQLRDQRQISVKILRRELVGDLFVCEVEGRTPDGRVDQASKYVPVTGYSRERGSYRLAGDRLSNAFAKAETGAKRRLTLSMVGLGMVPDESEMTTAKRVYVDAHGNVVEHPTDEQKYLSDDPRAARAIGEPTFETVALSEDAPIQGADQAPPPERMSRTRRDPNAPNSTFRMSDEDVERYRRTFFAIVDGLSLDNDEARHAYVAAYTEAEWPKNKRTASLSTFLRRATRDEAESLLEHTRALMAAEREQLLEDAPAHDTVDDLAEEGDEQEPF